VFTDQIMKFGNLSLVCFLFLSVFCVKGTTSSHLKSCKTCSDLGGVLVNSKVNNGTKCHIANVDCIPCHDDLQYACSCEKITGQGSQCFCNIKSCTDHIQIGLDDLVIAGFVIGSIVSSLLLCTSIYCFRVGNKSQSYVSFGCLFSYLTLMVLMIIFMDSYGLEFGGLITLGGVGLILSMCWYRFCQSHPGQWTATSV